MSKKNNSWRRSEKWPLGLLDETRKRIADEAEVRDPCIVQDRIYIRRGRQSDRLIRTGLDLVNDARLLVKLWPPGTIRSIGRQDARRYFRRVGRCF